MLKKECKNYTSACSFSLNKTKGNHTVLPIPFILMLS